MIHLSLSACRYPSIELEYEIADKEEIETGDAVQVTGLTMPYNLVTLNPCIR